MKEDVVAANLSSLRQSIDALKQSIEKNQTTEPPSEPTPIEVNLNEQLIRRSVASSFSQCWDETLSIIKRRVWKQEADIIPFEEWLPKMVDHFKKRLDLLEALISSRYNSLRSLSDIEDDTKQIKACQEQLIKKLDKISFQLDHPVKPMASNINGLFIRGRFIRMLYVITIAVSLLLCTVLSTISMQKSRDRSNTYYGMYLSVKQQNEELVKNHQLELKGQTENKK